MEWIQLETNISCEQHWILRNDRQMRSLCHERTRSNVLTIDEDLADLEHSLSAALDKASAAIPAVEQGALAAAEQNLARVRGQLAYSLAEARLKRVEQLFLAAHSEMVAAHQAGGATSYLGAGRYVPAREFRDLVLSQRAYWGV